MLFIIQFPICDARHFVDDPDLQIPVPDWPDPQVDIKPQFIHRIGKVVERRGSADMAWPDEGKFCLANRALQLPNLLGEQFGLAGNSRQGKGAFRRLFCDGRRVCVRFEIGLTVESRERAPKLLAASDVLAVVKGICELQTEVAGLGADRERNKLLRQGFALAKLYALSTLSLSASEKATKVIELVQGGNPLVFVELKSNEAPPRLIPEGFTAIPPERVDGASLVFGRLGTSAGVVGVWILQRGGPRRALQRSLRLTLMRLHAEQEALDLVLKQISRHRLLRPPSSRVVNDLNDYFNEKTRLIDRDEWGGIDQSAIREAFDASEHVTTPATRQNLVDRYEGTRRQVWEKIEEYQIRRNVKRHVTVVNIGKGALAMTQIVQNAPGIINVAEFMSQVTNQINNNLENSSSSDEVKALIKQLTDQVSAISPKIDPEQTKRMGGDLQTLTNEMAQAHPRRKWYELSLDGLKEAAEAVGELAAPIAETVRKIIPLLIGGA